MLIPVEVIAQVFHILIERFLVQCDGIHSLTNVEGERGVLASLLKEGFAQSLTLIADFFVLLAKLEERGSLLLLCHAVSLPLDCIAGNLPIHRVALFGWFALTED